MVFLRIQSDNARNVISTVTFTWLVLSKCHINIMIINSVNMLLLLLLLNQNEMMNLEALYKPSRQQTKVKINGLKVLEFKFALLTPLLRKLFRMEATQGPALSGESRS